MNDMQMGAVEARFADIIWSSEPISSTELAKRALEQLEWKKSTAFTVLKRLCEKGIFRNDGGTVSSVVSRGEFYSLQSRRFVEDTFDGSLPAFFTAFAQGRRLSPEEADAIRRMIDEYEEK